MILRKKLLPSSGSPTLIIKEIDDNIRLNFRLSYLRSTIIVEAAFKKKINQSLSIFRFVFNFARKINRNRVVFTIIRTKLDFKCRQNSYFILENYSDRHYSAAHAVLVRRSQFSYYMDICAWHGISFII